MAQETTTSEERPETAGGATVPSSFEEAGDLARQTTATAKEVASDVTADAREQVRHVAGEVTNQARDLLDNTRVELKEQADARTERAAAGLRSLSQQVRALTDGRPAEAGRLPEIAQDAQRRLSDLASRLDARGFDGVVEDVRRFARRRPMVFIALCAGSGFVLGRMARAARDGGNGEERSPQLTANAMAPRRPLPLSQEDAVGLASAARPVEAQSATPAMPQPGSAL